jgi:hypothetical protein
LISTINHLRIEVGDMRHSLNLSRAQNNEVERDIIAKGGEIPGTNEMLAKAQASAQYEPAEMQEHVQKVEGRRIYIN